MKNKKRLLFSLAIAGLSLWQMPVRAAFHFYADTTPSQTVNKEAKAIIKDYITAIGGADAIKKLNSIASTGNLSVQGATLDVTQKEMAPNRTAQIITMGGNTVGKTVFNGTKGYTEQMGNRADMGEEDITDMKQQTSLIEQTDYLTNPAYKLAVQGIDTVNGSAAYKVAVTKPSGKTDVEYYDVASTLLVQKDVSRTVSGQTISSVYQFSNYKKTGDVQLPYAIGLTVSSGAMSQTLNITLTDMKVNEGVTAADFE